MSFEIADSQGFFWKAGDEAYCGVKGNKKEVIVFDKHM